LTISSEISRHVASAARFVKAGRYAEAIKPLTEAARLDPNNALLLSNLGLANLDAGRVPEALVWLRAAVALGSSAGHIYLNFGLALQQAGDDSAAIDAYRHAVRLSPDLAAAHGRLADLLWEKGMRNEAALAYERASDYAPGTTLGRLQRAMARALGPGGRYREAEKELRQLIASDASDGRVHHVLGRVLLETGRFDEAAASFERSIAIAPWQAGPHHGLVSSKKIAEGDRPLVSRILARLDAKDWQTIFTPSEIPVQRMTLHFAAGKALDDLGDYADAFRHFDSANRIRREIAPPHERRELEQIVDRLISKFTREFFARHVAMGEDDEMPVLVVGMPRSGTTLIERILSSHPNVGGCGELDYWNAAGRAWAHAEPHSLARAADRVRADYQRLLRGSAPGALRAVDKMPFNFFWVGLVHLLLPSARIVHSRRNPVDTCLSIYTTQFGTAWAFASRLDELAWYYRLYQRLMDHWRSVIPPDRLLDVDYENVVAEPEQAARQLIVFCGLDWDSACLRPEDNHDTVRTASNWQARQPIYRTSVERWRRYEPWIGAIRELL
jgi:tetratricopeptide (TPR) repeat protein